MKFIDMGSLIYPLTMSSSVGSSATLDAIEELLCHVIVIPKTGKLLNIGHKINTVSSPMLTLKVSLETVAEVVGAPVATTDAGKTLYASGAQSAEIVNPSAEVRFDPINGANPSEGINVRKGDLVAIVIRCTAYTSGSVGVSWDQYSGNSFGLRVSGNVPGEYTYLGGTWTTAGGYSPISLQYDTGIVHSPTFGPVLSALTSLTWSNSSNPDRRGMKMRFPFDCTLRGILPYMDTDGPCQVILYDADGYTVMPGFPISLSANQRRTSGIGAHHIEFPTEPTLLKGNIYRLVILPTSTTSIGAYTITPADNGSVIGMNGLAGGIDFVYTSRNGEPSVSDNAWTDTETQRFIMAPIIGKINIEDLKNSRWRWR